METCNHVHLTYLIPSQSKELIRDQRDHLNATQAQCPVNFFTLAYPPIRNSSSAAAVDSSSSQARVKSAANMSSVRHLLH